MAGSKMPIAVAHGEGFTEYVNKEPSDSSMVNSVLAKKLATMRFIDNASTPTEQYPFNPNGSPQGLTGFTSTDGRFSIMMPHPERVIRNVQNTWTRCGNDEDSAWMRMFRNARKHVA